MWLLILLRLTLTFKSINTVKHIKMNYVAHLNNIPYKILSCPENTFRENLNSVAAIFLSVIKFQALPQLKNRFHSRYSDRESNKRVWDKSLPTTTKRVVNLWLDVYIFSLPFLRWYAPLMTKDDTIYFILHSVLHVYLYFCIHFICSKLLTAFWNLCRMNQSIITQLYGDFLKKNFFKYAWLG